MRKKQFIFEWFAIFIASCTTQPKKAVTVFTGADDEVIIMTIDPGHFHAALVQKISYKQIDPVVYVYAPEGPDAQDHLNRIEGFNTRANNPTNWNTKLYTGDDFLEKMIAEKPGNVMVTSGNNKKKTEYISKTINAGIHILADKPMAIDAGDFELLKETFISAEEKGVLLYDIMTERYSITSILQKELSKITDVFGELLVGSPENPSITKESVHHFFKYVAGNKIKRPPWFFDVTQQGEGLVDITTHLVDLIQWECFPEVILDYQKDIEVLAAKRWPTELTPSQFESVTRLTEYPEYLKKDIVNDSVLNVYCNGEIIYKLRGIHAKVSVIWNYRAPEGGGDTHFSVMRGTKANLVIRQGEEQKYIPELYIEPVEGVENMEFKQKLALAVEKLQEKFPGIELLKLEGKWQIIIPSEYRIGHEAHFGQVTQTFLQYLVDGKLPDWEVPNMIAKYYTTTRALELAKKE